MFEWIVKNIGSIIVALILLSVVAGIIYALVRTKKAGKSVCCSGCDGCKQPPSQDCLAKDMCSSCKGCKPLEPR